MKKVVKIGDKEYSLSSSAFTLFAYKDKTGRELLDDIDLIMKNQKALESGDVSKLGSIFNLLLDVTYVMYKEGDKEAVEYNDFLRGLDGMFDDVKWVNDVVECAVSPFSRNLHKSSAK